MFSSIGLSRCAYESHNITIQAPAGHPPLLEPGNILKHKDTQTLFKIILGESAQISLGPGPHSSFSQQVGMASVPVCTCHQWPSHSLPCLYPSASGQVRKCGVQPDALLLCWEFLEGSSRAGSNLNISSPQDCKIHSLCIGINGRKRCLLEV